MTVDFAEVRKIPIASALAMRKVETRKRSNTELVANCPLPSHEKSAHKQMTFAISLEKNKWYCHSDTCRAAGNHPRGGDVIDLQSRLDNSTALEAAKKLAEMFCVGNGKPALASASAGEVRPTVTGQGKNTPLAFVLKDVDPAHEFIQSRGITVETATHFNVGYFSGKGSMANRVVFPCYENGSLIAYVGRYVGEPDENNPKWRVPLGLHRTFVYGLEKCSPERPLILCESPWAVLHFFQHKQQCAALIGTSMTEAQERSLEPYDRIIVAMDNDQPGREASAKLVERLKQKPGRKVSVAWMRE